MDAQMNVNMGADIADVRMGGGLYKREKDEEWDWSHGGLAQGGLSIVVPEHGDGLWEEHEALLRD